MFFVFGMGFHYNDVFRMGAIFPSDIILALTILYMLFTSKNLTIKRKIVCAFVIALFEIGIGMVARNELGNILRDFKIFIYFFAIYWVLDIYCEKEKNVGKIFKYYLFVVSMSVVLNVMNFFENGLTNIDKGEILRTFAIGLGWGAVVPMLLIVNTYRDEFVKRYGAFAYYSIELASLMCVAISCTRTAWISLLIAFVLKKILVDRTKINANSLIRVLCVVTVAVVVVQCLYKSNNPVFNVLYSRFTGIIDAIQEDDSTWAYRIDDVSSSFYKFMSPRIIIGYGYGDTRIPYGYRKFEIDAEVGCENSFFYYVWKYGIIFTAILFALVLKKIGELWKRTRASKVWAVYLFVYMVIGSMSGNLSNTYSIAIYALYFILAENIDTGLRTLKIDDNEMIKASKGIKYL